MTPTRTALAAGLALALAGCSSLGLTPATSRSQALDYLNDDLGAMALAFDLPEALEPVPGDSRLGFLVQVPGRGERQVEALLVPGDAEAVAGLLPPPADGRSYYVFGLQGKDAAALREAQGWARAEAEGGAVPQTPVISIAPRFCATAALDAARLPVSVHLLVPGRTAVPLIEGQTLAALAATSGGGRIPACAGHSG